MAEKCSVEGGNRRVDNSNSWSEPTMYLANIMKNGTKSICRLREKKTKSIDLLVSSYLMLTLIEYKERHDKIGHYINKKTWKYYEY